MHDAQTLPTWGVVCTIKAPLEKTRAFVAHHLAMGASHVAVFLDDPEDPAFDALKGLQNVSVTRCDAAHWEATTKTRPDMLEKTPAWQYLARLSTCPGGLAGGGRWR